MPTNFCDSNVRAYPETARSCSDHDLQEHLNKWYPSLNRNQLRDPMFRHWRRCVIVEMLNRGLLKKDPGPNHVPNGRVA